jgi:hypothetical protein
MTDLFHTLIVRGHNDGSIKKKIDAASTAEGLTAAVVGMNAMKRLNCSTNHLKSVVACQLSLLA